LPDLKPLEKAETSDSKEKNKQQSIDENSLIANEPLKGSSSKLNNDSAVVVGRSSIPSSEVSPSLNLLASVIKTFLPNTRCNITNEMRAFLIKLLGNKPVTSTLLYSGHLHGWEYEDFHYLCDSKGRTVSLFQIKDGDCIGGYTSQCWESSWAGKYKADRSAFLFNLTRSRHFPSKGTGKDICCTIGHGPLFSGFGDSDLGAASPFNGKN
jgi:hypothetical protein